MDRPLRGGKIHRGSLASAGTSAGDGRLGDDIADRQHRSHTAPDRPSFRARGSGTDHRAPRAVPPPRKAMFLSRFFGFGVTREVKIVKLRARLFGGRRGNAGHSGTITMSSRVPPFHPHRGVGQVLAKTGQGLRRRGMGHRHAHAQDQRRRCRPAPASRDRPLASARRKFPARRRRPGQCWSWDQRRNAHRAGICGRSSGRRSRKDIPEPVPPAGAAS